MRTFVVGDIHGAYKALQQCLQRCGFVPEKDRLIVLGDVCDGYPEVRQCVNYLNSLPNKYILKGNHDVWALRWALTWERAEGWTSQGGDNTILSYDGGPVPDEHKKFLSEMPLWLELDNKLYIHGGYNPERPLDKQDEQILLWDRSLLNKAYQMHASGWFEPFGGYEDIFVGHTTTQFYNSSIPLRFCNVWAMDTGAGWSGRLTVMNVDNHLYWQSDPTPALYGFNGRV